MSFILDALRKVEAERKRSSSGEESRIAIEGGREWAQPRSVFVLTLATVALLALVAIGLATYDLIRTRSSPPRATATVDLRAADPAPAASFAPPPAPRSPATSAVVSAPAPVTPPPSAAPAALEGQPEVEPDVEPAPPVRLVGAGSDVSRAAASPPAPVDVVEETPPAEAPAADPSSSAEPPPRAEASLSPLPDLVLQGTALVEDRAVAIVNFQKVFEGDIISGARVMKILDRAIELEYLGKRYTLRF